MVATHVHAVPTDKCHAQTNHVNVAEMDRFTESIRNFLLEMVATTANAIPMAW